MTAPAPRLDLVKICRTCSGWVGWISGTMPPKELARFASECVKGGFRLDEVTTEAARRMDTCECWRKADDDSQLSLIPEAQHGT